MVSDGQERPAAFHISGTEGGRLSKSRPEADGGKRSEILDPEHFDEVSENIICPRCNTLNDAGYEFCVNCGNRFASGFTEAEPSVATQFVGFGQAVSPPAERRRSPILWLAAILAVLLLLAGGAIFAVFQLKPPSELLPDHLGMFVQAEAKDHC